MMPLHDYPAPRWNTYFSNLLFAISICAFLYASPLLNADTVTLNSGDVITGRILAESDTNVTVEIANARRTIVSKRIILKTDIKGIIRETAEKAQEMADYATLAQFKLYPNQELTEAQYAAGISAFQGFLQANPTSGYAAELSNRIVVWQTEVSNVQSGQVKFANKWMTPEEKAAQSTQSTVNELQVKLGYLQQSHKNFLRILQKYKGCWPHHKANSPIFKIHNGRFIERLQFNQENTTSKAIGYMEE